MEFASLVRFIIAALTLTAFLFFAIRINDDWRSLSRGWKVTRCSLLGAIFVLAYGTVEVMQAEPAIPLGTRNILIPVAVIGLLVGLWMVRKEPSPSLIVDKACRFPGCIIARKDLRAAALKYPHGIPPHVVVAIIDGVEAHEHQ